MKGGGQRPFGTFPKIHPFWYRYSSFVTRPRTTVFISDWITRKKQEQTVLQRSGRLNLEPPWCQKSDLTSLLAISDHLWKKFPRGWGQGVKKKWFDQFSRHFRPFLKELFSHIFWTWKYNLLYLKPKTMKNSNMYHAMSFSWLCSWQRWYWCRFGKITSVGPATVLPSNASNFLILSAVNLRGTFPNGLYW